MSAVWFVLLVVGVLVMRAAEPSTIDEAIRRHINGPTRTEIVAAVMAVIGVLLLIVGVAIKLWEWMP